MNREDIVAMARWSMRDQEKLERFAQWVAQAERQKVANWMLARSYATGHGDTVEDLLKELEWQVAQAEREACAKVCENLYADLNNDLDCRKHWSNRSRVNAIYATAIRARGQA